MTTATEYEWWMDPLAAYVPAVIAKEWHEEQERKRDQEDELVLEAMAESREFERDRLWK